MSLKIQKRSLGTDELEQVVGGLCDENIQRGVCQYKDCKKMFPIDLRKSDVMCPYCRRNNHFSG